MKILFVSSGNKKSGISPIVRNQAESLQSKNIDIDFFTIGEKGIKGYINHFFPLYNTIKKGNYDVIHAHYSLCGFLATIASLFSGNIVVSLMGSFTKGSVKYRLIRFLAKYNWKAVIVKSERMREQIGLNEAYLIPNGVQTEKFILPQTRDQIRALLGIKSEQKLVIFVSDPLRPEKNFTLCKKSVELLNYNNLVLVPVYNKPHDEVVKYMLAADVLMLTSFSEGSPNVIKEAMAAQCPIVTTNVGDVEYVLDGLEGTYIMHSFLPEEGAELLKEALNFNKRTQGLNQLKKINLSADAVADKMIQLYNNVI